MRLSTGFGCLTALSLGFLLPLSAPAESTARSTVGVQVYSSQHPAIKGTGLGPAEIRRVQQALNAAGYDPGPVDGQWGRSTDSALRRFQRDKGAIPTGDLDILTFHYLGLPVSEFAVWESRASMP